MAWNPFGVSLEISATAGAVTRISATQFTVKITAAWETYYSGAQTNYGMTASSGGSTVVLNAFGTKSSGSSKTLTGTYSISGNGSATKSISVTFKNFNNDTGKTASKVVTITGISVPAWTSYKVAYNANGGSGAPSSQTKWKDQTLTLSTAKPTRSGYSFQKWNTAANGSGTNYSSGGSYTANAAATLYAVWKANTYVVSYNANGGSGGPSTQNKTHGVTLTLSTTKPTRENYIFKGWGISATATSVTYAAGASYTANAPITLYAIWEYTNPKPIIKNLSASRNDSNTAITVKFDWSTATNTSVSYFITVCDMSGTFIGGAGGSSVGASGIQSTGAAGTITHSIVNDELSPEESYTVVVSVKNEGVTTERSVTVSSSEYHIDFSENSVAIGKTAETLLNENGAEIKAFDVKWRSKFREHVCVGEKIGYHDGKTGIFMSHEGFMHLQRTSAQGFHPYIGFYIDDGTATNGQIRLNSSTKYMDFLNASGYHFGSDIYLDNNEAIMGYDTNEPPTAFNAFQAKNSSNDTIVGYGNYEHRSGNTNIYGYDLNFGVANIATPGTYRPYRRQGDTITVSLRTAGYVTNSKQNVIFWIPLTEPIVGSPTVTVASTNGLILRQSSAYTHGSTAEKWVSPTSYEASVSMFNGVCVTAVFSKTTNAVNNSPIGIAFDGTITFS